MLAESTDSGTLSLPFAWNGVTLHADEASAVRVGCPAMASRSG